MRYYEIIESLEHQRADAKRAKDRRARDRIAQANRKRSTAAARYQDELKTCADAVLGARASLRERFNRSNALRDRRGVVLGWIEPHGRLLQAKDANGTVVGWYDPQQNVTKDRSGALVGTGDLLSAIVACQSLRAK